MASVNDENAGAQQNAAASTLTSLANLSVLKNSNVPLPTKKRKFATVTAPAKGDENSAANENNAAPVKAEGGGIDVAALPDPTDGPARKRRPGRRWTPQEDAVLRELVNKNGNRHWKRIAKEFAERSGSVRSDVQCLHRWNKCLKPGLLKGPWTAEEDNTIRKMIAENGGPQNVRWSVIAKLLKGRLGKQVRERWINHLDPSINKGEWTPEEDENLYQLQQRFGNRWKWIAELLPGRSENGVKNRWHSIKPGIMARKGDASAVAPVSQGKGKNDPAAASSAAKTATAAAVAAAVAASKKTKRAPRASKATKKTKAGKKSGKNSPSASLADLLQIGQQLVGPEQRASPGRVDRAGNIDVAAVAEKAKELLQMSESYREMAKLVLNNSKQGAPGSPQFNAHLQREIANQIAKQLGQQQRQQQQQQAMPPAVLTSATPGSGFSGLSNSPLSSDPVLFNTYFNVFSNSMQLSAAAAASANLDGKPVSPHQLLAAAAQAAQDSASI